MRHRDLARAGLEIDDEDVLVAAAVEAAHQLVLAIVAAESPAALPGRQRHVTHRIVGEPDELLRRHAILGDVVVGAIARLLDFLLRLQPRILVVPQHEVDLVLVVRGGSDRSAAPSPPAGGASASVRIGSSEAVLLARLVEAEDQRLQIVGPQRIADSGLIDIPLGTAASAAGSNITFCGEALARSGDADDGVELVAIRACPRCPFSTASASPLSLQVIRS